MTWEGYYGRPRRRSWDEPYKNGFATALTTKCLIERDANQQGDQTKISLSDNNQGKCHPSPRLSAHRSALEPSF